MLDSQKPTTPQTADRPGAGGIWVLIFLMLVYTVIFGPSVFARIFDSEFMQIDPRSIMDSIDGLTTAPVYYNMNDQYHSQFYGWTYFSMNFALVTIGKFFGFTKEIDINFITRAALFVVGAGLVTQLFWVARRFFSIGWSAFATFVFMVNPVSAHYFTTIHPETLGMLFQLVAIGLLIKVFDADIFPRRIFWGAVVALSLSALSKQSYLIVGVLIYLTFFITYAKARVSDRAPMTWGMFSFLTIQGVGIFLIVLFAIHPYAILEPFRFLQAQSTLTNDHATKTLSEAWWLWREPIIMNFIVFLNLIILFAIPFFKQSPLAYKLSVIFSCFAIILLASNARLFIHVNYIYPIYCILYFNAFYFLIIVLLPWLKSFGQGWIYVITQALALTVITVVTLSNLMYSTTATHNRLFLDKLSTTNVVWNNIKDFPMETRTVYSPDVAVLHPLKSNSCNAWSGCGNIAGIQNFDPDLVIFSPEYQYIDAEEFRRFVSENGFTLLHEVKPEPFETANRCLSAGYLRSTLMEGLVSTISLYMTNPKQCIAAYKSGLKAYRSGQVVHGETTLIYAKER